jgi:hypothetical protein
MSLISRSIRGPGWCRAEARWYVGYSKSTACPKYYVEAPEINDGFTNNKSLGKELSKGGVTVNAVAPAVIETPMLGEARYAPLE